MRNGIVAILVLVMLSVSIPVLAQDAPDLSLVMDNIAYKFTYAFFGYDALLWIVQNPEHVAVIKSASEAELVSAASPFNTDVFHTYMTPMLVGVYAMTAGYFLLRASAFVLEYLWLTKRKGVFPMGPEAFREFVLRFVLVGGVILAPVVTNGGFPIYSAQQRVSMEFFSHSISFSDEALVELIDSQRQSLVTTKIPKSEDKISVGEAINEFFVCVRTSPDYSLTSRTPSIQYEKDIDSAQYKATINAGGCNLQLTMGLDAVSDKKVETARRAVGDYIVGQSGLESAQDQIFPELIREFLQDGVRYSAVLARGIESTRFASREHLDEQYAMRLWTRDSLGEADLVNWEAHCDDFERWNYPNERLTTKDRLVYHYIASRCSSYKVSKKLLYPESETDISQFLAAETLTNRHIPLCRGTLIDMSGKTPEYQVEHVSANYGRDYTMSLADELSLDACVQRLCEDHALVSGSLYLCTKATALYEQLVKDSEIKRKGVMGLGAYMFSMFTHPELSDTAKVVFNGVSGKFSRNKIDVDTTKITQEMAYSLPSQIEGVPSSDGLLIQAYIEDQGNNYDVIQLMRAEASDDPFAFFSKIGFARLSACTKNPLEVVDGYVCGNVAQELSVFGKGLIETSVNLTTYMATLEVGHAVANMKLKSDKQKVGGSTSETGVKREGIVNMLAVIIGGRYVNSYIDHFLGYDSESVDSFGQLSKSDYELLVYGDNPVSALVMYAAAHKASIASKLVYWTLSFMFLFGVFAAVILPFIPVMMFMYALGKAVFLLVKILMLHGIKMTDIVFEESPDIFVESVDRVIADWLAMFLKLPLTMVGVVLAWVLSNVMVSKVSKVLDLGVLFSAGEGLSVTGFIDSIAIMLVTVIVMFMVFNLVLTIIEAFYDFTVEWMLGNMTSDPFSEHSIAKWQDVKGSYDLTSKAGSIGSAGLPGGKS